MPFVMMNPLIVMLGMSIYDKLTQLPQLYGCYEDYRNIIKAFNFNHGYSIVYLNENNDLIYIDKKHVDSKDIDDKFKVKWTYDEIEIFNQQIKQEILNDTNKYNHDSLIYIISCHGNRDESIYDYNGEEYLLDYIYHEFNNKECKILREKPKLFIIDADRVDINVLKQTKIKKQQKKSTRARPSQHHELKNEYRLKLNSNQVSSSSNYKASQSFTTDSHLRKIFCNTKDGKFVTTGKNGAFLIQALTNVLLSKSSNNIDVKTFSQLLREMRIIMSQLMAIPNQSVVIHDRNSLPYKIQFGHYNSDNINYSYDEFKSENKSSESNLNMVNNDIEPQIYTMCKPLIVFLGISKYSGMNNLDCVPTDFENIIKSFHIKRGYHIAYCDKNSGKLIIIDEVEKTKSISHHVSYLKLQWNENDILLFNKMVFQYLAKNYTKNRKKHKNKSKSKADKNKNNYKNKINSKTKNAQNSNNKRIKMNKSKNQNQNKNQNKNENTDSKNDDDDKKVCESRKGKYDGLMYFISCHGDSGGVIYDSHCDKLPLVTIFDQFNNQNCIYLRNKPKIYWVSACRGNMRTKRFANSNFVIHENDTLISDHDEVKTKPQTNMDSKEDNNSYDDCKTQLQEKNDDNKNSNNAQKYLNLHLFSKFNWNRVVYANTEGYGVVEPGSKGEYMIRSIVKAFVNDDIFECDLDQIIVQIRRILVKLMGTSIECAAQVIDDHNDIPANLFFKSNNDNTPQEKQN